jgi:hypothetical protein
MIQKITLTHGCPNGCEYCYAPKSEFKTHMLPVLYHETTELQILDMNFLSNPDSVNLLRSFALMNIPKELVCGFDYRLFNETIAILFKLANFHKIRWAWDYSFLDQKIHRKTLLMLLKAGYKARDLSVFILVNWKISYIDCCRKLDLLKVWGVKALDCCYDGGYPKSEIDYNSNKRFNDKRNWKYNEIRNFRKICRKHNQLVLFKIDPEAK